MAPQSYYLGGKIRASDFNGFANDINEIVGLGAGDSGYGQDQLLVTLVNAGQKIRAVNWNQLLKSIHFAAQHQGTGINIPTSTLDPDFPAPNKIISIIPDLENDIANVRANKLNYDIAKMTFDSNKLSTSKTYYSPTEAATDPNKDDWTDTVSYEFKSTFVDEDAMRNFFNAGGEVRISSDLTAYDQRGQNESWANILSAIAVVKFSLTTTVSSAEIGTPGVGFTGLTNDYQLVYSKGGAAGYYSGNQLNIYARKTGTNTIDFKVEFYDSYTDTPSASNNFPGVDYVDGTLTVTVDQQRADDDDVSGDGVVSPSPIYSHISEL